MFQESLLFLQCRRSYIFSAMMLLAITQSFGVGVNDLDPNNDQVSLSFKRDQDGRYNDFMSFNSTEDERLHVYLKAGETLEFGFQFEGGTVANGFNPINSNVWISIREEVTNNQVFLEEVVAGNPGYINNRAEANTGPISAINPNGYDPFLFTAANEGNYYIELAYSFDGITDGFGNDFVSRNWTHFIAPLYDFTVRDIADQIQDGRVWSKAWHIFVKNGWNGDLVTTQYIYTDDGIISELDYNGIIPYQYVLISNSTGVFNTGNFLDDRKSINSDLGNELLPQYKLFFDVPDTNIFKLANLDTLFGDLNKQITITGCPGDYCINIDVNKSGIAILLLDLNGIDGYDPNTKDVRLEVNLSEGENCIEWDGLDGLGQVVTSGNIQLDIEFTAGITHLPMFDVEYNTNGLNVNFIYPESIAGPTEIYWDDDQVGGTVNDIVGCPSECHSWEPGFGFPPSNDFGNQKILNSWWFLKKDPLTSSIVISVPPFNIGPDQEICAGDTTSVESPEGMTSYSWTPQAIFESPNTRISDVIPTEPTYAVLSVTDSFGCDYSDSLFIDFYENPEATIDPVNSLCEPGSVNLNASGGNSYLWFGNTTGLSATNINNPVATISTTTTYEVEVTSIEGCKDTASVEILVGDGVNVIVDPVEPVCEGESTNINVTGAETYTWIGNTTGLSATNIGNPIVTINTTTTYTVAVSQGDCKDTTDVEVVINQRPTASVDLVPPYCIGASTTLNASGGTEYLWISNTDGLSSTVINNPVTTTTETITYNVEVTDLNGCKDTAEVNVTVNPLPTVIASEDTNTCTGESVTISATGANTYSWSPAATLSATTGNSVEASPTNDTYYFVEGTDINNCKARDSVLVQLVDGLVPSVEITNDEGCDGDNFSFQISTSEFLGSNPTYQWFIIPFGSNDTIRKTQTETFSTNELATGDQVGLLATSSISCVASGSKNVYDVVNPDVYQYPNLVISGDTAICVGENGVLTVTDLANVTNVFTWRIFPDNEVVLTPDREFIFNTVSQNGAYYVSASNPNFPSCTSSSAPVVIGVVEPFIRATVSCPVILNGEIVTVSASTNTQTYSWVSSLETGVISTDLSFSDQPNKTVVYTISGDLNGCTVSDSVRVKVLYPFEAPYFFSPNNDGENDVWIVKNLTDYESYTVTIYNRWGNVIKRYVDEFEPWDGANKTGVQVPDGVYYYVIKTSIKDKPIELSGYVTVAR